MKFFLILSLMSFSALAQTGIVSYNVESLKNDYKHKEIAENLNKEIELMSFTLSYNTELSYFQQDRSIPLNPLYYKLASTVIHCISPWYQFPKQKESIFNGKVKNNVYQIVHNNLKIEEWELTDETKTIDGYVCYKAKKSKLNERTEKYYIYTVWYTPDIPAPYGPAGEGGLPGLILQLNLNNNFIYTVKEITLNPKKINIPKLKEAERIDSKEFAIKLRKARMVTED